jgi:hypothetical protein
VLNDGPRQWSDEHTPGWTDALAQVPPTLAHRPFVHNLPANPRHTHTHTHHPPGGISKAALAHFVLSDLSLGIYDVRRYVRLEYLGLSGIIFLLAAEVIANAKTTDVLAWSMTGEVKRV